MFADVNILLWKDNRLSGVGGGVVVPTYNVQGRSDGYDTTV